MIVGLIFLVLGIGVFVGLIYLFRWLGAWMLRIDEVLVELRKINRVLNNNNNKLN